MIHCSDMNVDIEHFLDKPAGFPALLRRLRRGSGRPAAAAAAVTSRPSSLTAAPSSSDAAETEIPSTLAATRAAPTLENCNARGKKK